jgi:hypothetical protein
MPCKETAAITLLVLLIQKLLHVQYLGSILLVNYMSGGSSTHDEWSSYNNFYVLVGDPYSLDDYTSLGMGF